MAGQMELLSVISWRMIFKMIVILQYLYNTTGLGNIRIAVYV